MGQVCTTVGRAKVGSFVLRTTKLRTWMAAGATHLHHHHPADCWDSKQTILQTFSGPISFLFILPSQTMGNSNLHQQREFPDGAGALHLPQSGCVSRARLARQKIRQDRIPNQEAAATLIILTFSNISAGERSPRTTKNGIRQQVSKLMTKKE